MREPKSDPRPGTEHDPDTSRDPNSPTPPKPDEEGEENDEDVGESGGRPSF